MPAHVAEDNMEQALRLRIMKQNPVAHYSLLKRREVHPLVEKFEDMKLDLGLREPSQTNNNLSKKGMIRRARHIYDYEHRISDLAKWTDDANLDSKFHED